MSRFCVDPRWLVYLPPTMSPSETSRRDGLLEYPEEAFSYYRNQGVGRVVMEEKHMGSRAVVVIARDGEAARKRFGVSGKEAGIIYTRTGRPFFSDKAMGDALLDRLRGALDRSGFWDKFQTDWACLDAELMPWSAKAQSLIAEQYAPVGSAAISGLTLAADIFAQAIARDIDTADLSDKFAARRDAAIGYDAAWRRYSWGVASVDDLRLAPFHLLATEGAVHDDKDHTWHMNTLAEICAADAGVLFMTQWREVDLADETAIADACTWWGNLTGKGGEGTVIKPQAFLTRGEKGDCAASAEMPRPRILTYHLRSRIYPARPAGTAEASRSWPQTYIGVKGILVGTGSPAPFYWARTIAPRT